YFAYSGLHTNLGLLNDGITWGYVVLICVVAFFAKFLGCAIAAKLSGFNLRESGAIGTLMSCKGLVELIVLNVGLSAGILDTRTFSMFVLHAIILTFMTTPLTLLFYPARHRSHIGGAANPSGSEIEAGRAFPPNNDLQTYLKSRFSVIVDRIEQLPAVLTLMQLLHVPPPAPAPSTVDEKASLRHANSVSSFTGDSDTRVSPQNRRISLDALRLIELTNRTSAVLRSQEAETLVHSDPILAVLKTSGYLNGMNVSTALAVVGSDDFPIHVAQHVRDVSSQMVILPWVTPVAPVDEGAVPTSGQAASTSEPPTSPPGAAPFDALFQQKRDRSAVAGQAQYIRRVFADAPADVALFWDRGLPQTFTSAAAYHLFLPFFGGPDDRLALSFVAQLCMNPGVTATVVRVRRLDNEAVSPMTSIDEAKARNLLHSETLHTVLPDTVYGAHTTQTRLASDTADNLAWARYTSTAHTLELGSSLSRIEFAEETSAAPLHTVLDLAARSSSSRARLVVVAGRSRRMATESHFDELRQLCVEHNASLGSELPKILGDVASAFVATGSNASIAVVQAAR
ncbi:hypothetical protein BC628DRAFT_1340137, partial [Trametes gibbosa]